MFRFSVKILLLIFLKILEIKMFARIFENAYLCISSEQTGGFLYYYWNNEDKNHHIFRTLLPIITRSLVTKQHVARRLQEPGTAEQQEL